MDTRSRQSKTLLAVTLAMLVTVMLLVAVGCPSPNRGLVLSWHIEAVDTAGAVGYNTSIALSSNGHPHISYRGVTNDDLKCACWNGFAWVGQHNAFGPDSVDATTEGHNSIALDDSGRAHISYWDYANRDLKYARYGE